MDNRLQEAVEVAKKYISSYKDKDYADAEYVGSWQTLISYAEQGLKLEGVMPKVEDYDLESLPIEKLVEIIIDDCTHAIAQKLEGVMPKKKDGVVALLDKDGNRYYKTEQLPEANWNEAIDLCTHALIQKEEELKRLRVQLAGCGVAALGYATGKNEVKKGDYGWSASFQDVQDLWEKYNRLIQKLEGLEGILEKHITHVSLYHDKEGGRITQEQIIFKARFKDLAIAIKTSILEAK